MSDQEHRVISPAVHGCRWDPLLPPAALPAHNPSITGYVCALTQAGTICAGHADCRLFAVVGPEQMTAAHHL